jgi:hypothetical protein
VRVGKRKTAPSESAFVPLQHLSAAAAQGFSDKVKVLAASAFIFRAELLRYALEFRGIQGYGKDHSIG